MSGEEKIFIFFESKTPTRCISLVELIMKTIHTNNENRSARLPCAPRSGLEDAAFLVLFSVFVGVLACCFVAPQQRNTGLSADKSPANSATAQVVATNGTGATSGIPSASKIITGLQTTHNS